MPPQDLSDAEIARVVRLVLSLFKRQLESQLRGQTAVGTDSQSVRRLILQIEDVRVLLVPLERFMREEPTPLSTNMLTEAGAILDGILESPAFSELLGRHAGFRREIRRPPGRDIKMPGELLQANTYGDALRILIGVVRAGLQEEGERPSETLFLFRLLPEQKLAPLQFEISDGRLVLVPLRASAPAEEDSEVVASAREELVRNGKRVLEALAQSNCDRRLVETFERLQTNLEENIGIVTVGIANIQCEALCSVFHNELPDALSGMLHGHTRAVGMYAGQFPEWHQFVQNARDVDIEAIDNAKLYNDTRALAEALRREPEIVDEEIPTSLVALAEVLRHPRRSGKRAAYALVRSIENLISRVFRAGVQFMDDTLQKSVKGLSTAISGVVVVALLSMAVEGAKAIAPLANAVPDLVWVRQATDIVVKQIERIKGR